MPPTQNVERLLSLALTLTSSTRGLTREEVTELVPGYERMNPTSVRRQFTRDLARLAKLGIDVDSTPDLVNPSTLRYTASVRDAASSTGTFDAHERLMLGAAAAMWSTQSAGSLGARIRAKLASLGVPPVSGIARGALGSSPASTPLLEALESGKTVTFAYRSSAAAAAHKRRVEPWAFDVARGREYLYGYDLDREAPRLFRVSRIESIPVEGPSAKHAREPHPPIRSLLSNDRTRAGQSNESAEQLRVRIAPYKALDLRSQLGMDARSPVAEVPPSKADGILSAAWAEPLWVALEGDHSLATTWALTRARIAALHTGPASLTWEHASTFDTVKQKRARDVGTGDGELTRLSAEIAYLHSFGDVAVADMARDFGLTVDELNADLDIIYNAGDYSRGYDELVEVTRADGYVSIAGADPLARPMTFTASEISALLIGLEAVADSRGGFSVSGIEALRTKLAAMVPEGAAQGGQPSESSRDHENPTLMRILDAHATKHPVRIMYSPAARHGISIRDIEPREVTSKYGALYVRAYCRLAGAEREFRSDRIVDSWECTDPAAPATGDFTTPLDVALENWPTVTLAIGPKARWILDAFNASELRAEPNSTRVIARITPSSSHALLAAIFETDGEAEVLDPDHIRSAIRGVAETKVAHLGE